MVKITVYGLGSNKDNSNTKEVETKPMSIYGAAGRLIRNGNLFLGNLLHGEDFEYHIDALPGQKAGLRRFLWTDAENFNKDIPQYFLLNGFGKYVLNRPNVVHMVLMEIQRQLHSEPYNSASAYLSGCRGMGKTSTMALIARELKLQGWEVYWFKSARLIPVGAGDAFAQYAKENKHKKIAVVVDEVAADPDSDLFTSLLKGQLPNVLTIGASVPHFNPTGAAATFRKVFRSYDLLLRPSDQDVQGLIAHWKAVQWSLVESGTAIATPRDVTITPGIVITPPTVLSAAAKSTVAVAASPVSSQAVDVTAVLHTTTAATAAPGSGVPPTVPSTALTAHSYPYDSAAPVLEIYAPQTAPPSAPAPTAARVITPEMIEYVSNFLLDHCGGHVYPVVAFMEYFFTNPKASECMTSELAFQKHFRSAEFAGSDIYRKVLWRCFNAAESLEPESAKTTARVLGGKGDSSDVRTLTRLGWWDPDSRAILSALLMNACLSSVQPETEDVIYLQGSDWKANLEQLIIVGIFNMEPHDLIRISAGGSGWPVENALSFNWAFKVRAHFANVHLEFQSPRGNKLVDFYVNGVVGAGVEMLQNATQTVEPETKPQSQDIDEHADRFKPGGSYGGMQRYALLNFCMDEQKDVVLPRDAIHHDRVYTFKLSNNSLYRGSTLIRSPAVSQLPSRTPYLGQNATYCTSARVAYLSASDTNTFSASLDMLTLRDANTEAAPTSMLSQCSYYSYGVPDVEDDLPHLGIIDPRKLLALTGFIPPKDLMIKLIEFVGCNSLTGSRVTSALRSGVASGADSGYNSDDDAGARKREDQENASTAQAQGQAQQQAQQSLVMAAQRTRAPPLPLVSAVSCGPIPAEPAEDEESVVKVSIKRSTGMLSLRSNNTAAVASTSKLSLRSTAAASASLAMPALVRIPSTAHFTAHGSRYWRNLLLFRAAAPKMLLRALRKR